MQCEEIREVRREVRDCVVNGFYVPDELGDSASLVGSGVIESLLELVGLLQSSFGIRVEHHEIRPENLDSIARIAAFVCRKKAAAEAVLGEPVEEAGDDPVDDVGMSHGGHVTDAVELDQIYPG